ncbi:MULTISPECIES: NfeD family protein [unclassified Nocardioides]|uniref:NfeD family protein n=1 Tax=unclassified Nocardioides TaxID=2615069 RepID=UPI00361CDE8C
MEWLGEHAWAAWVGAAAFLATAELFSLDLVLGMLAVGALGGAVTAAAGGAVALQLAVAAIVAIGMLAVVRPSLVARLHKGPDLVLGTSKLVGRRATVTERITGLSAGRISLAGETWSAAPYDEHLTIEAGETVEVFEIRGATAYVHPVPELEP